MLVILSTHPIQYQVPLYQAMAKLGGIDFEVWYLTNHGIEESYDVQFGKAFKWDLNLLDGYVYEFINTNEGASPGTGFWNIRLGKNFTQLLKEKKVSHLWVNGWQVLAYWQAVNLASKLGINICLRGESNVLKPEIPWKWPLKKVLMQSLFSKVDCFLYIGGANKRLYQKYGIEENRLLPGYYAVDNERFSKRASALQANRSAIRQKWNIDDDAKVVLFSGKFIAKKRPLDIIKAAKLLYDQGYKNIHLLYVGSGELYRALWSEGNVVYNALSSDLLQQEAPKISFTGFLNQTEMPEAYVAADCLILPSDHGETWGLVVNEALACDLPCMVSNRCGCNEDLVKPYSPELVFEFGNINSIANTVELFFSHPENYSIALNNRIQQFSYNTTINSIQKIIKSL